MGTVSLDTRYRDCIPGFRIQRLYPWIQDTETVSLDTGYRDLSLDTGYRIQRLYPWIQDTKTVSLDSGYRDCIPGFRIQRLYPWILDTETVSLVPALNTYSNYQAALVFLPP